MKTPQMPFPRLGQTLGITSDVWLKREDLHHYSSHKGRSIPIMINEARKTGVAQFVISSSGNAAIAAAQAISTYNKNPRGTPLRLTIFVGEHIADEKLNKLKKIIAEDKALSIQQVPNPKQSAFQLTTTDPTTKWLRQSTEDSALIGYHELALELAKIPNLSAVFVPTSSGTTAVGLARGFAALNLNPEIHIIQTDVCHPMVETAAPPTAAPSLASAIVDKIARRKPQVTEIVKTSGGAGWVATNESIVAAQKLIKETANLNISANSALSVVGLTEAIRAGRSWPGPVACLITGP